MKKPQHFKDRLRRFRSELGWTQKELAKHLGVSEGYIGMLESGREPSDTLAQLFELLEARQLNSESEPSSFMATGPRAVMRQAREKKGYDFKKLSELTRYGAAALRRVEQGDTRASEDMIRAIAKALDLDPELLMDGSDEPVVHDPVRGTFGTKPNINVPKELGRAKHIPLISMATAGTMGAYAWTDGSFTYEGTLAFDPKDPKAYGIIIKGDSMFPQYSDGDTAIVYPNFPLRIDKPVVCRLKEEVGGDVLFKIYSTKDNGQRVVLSSYNPRFEPADYELDKFVWIHPVYFVMKTV